MDITEVKTKVDANIGAGDVLTLRYQGNNLNSPPIDAVIHTYFADSLSGKVQRVNGETGVVDKTKQTVVYKLNLAVQNFALYKSAAPIFSSSSLLGMMDQSSSRLRAISTLTSLLA